MKANKKPFHHTQSVLHSHGLNARASTNYPVNPPEFQNHQGNYKYNALNYKGPGYVVRPGYASQRALVPTEGVRSQASSRGEGWLSNTQLELEQVVYPDGVRKNSSHAQQEIYQDQTLMRVKARIDSLMKIGTKEALAEIEMLQHRYFPSEKVTSETQKIHVSAAGHAAAAESQRQEILDELRALRIRGLVGGGGGGSGGSTPLGLGGMFGSPAGSAGSSAASSRRSSAASTPSSRGGGGGGGAGASLPASPLSSPSPVAASTAPLSASATPPTLVSPGTGAAFSFVRPDPDEVKDAGQESTVVPQDVGATAPTFAGRTWNDILNIDLNGLRRIENRENRVAAVIQTLRQEGALLVEITEILGNPAAYPIKDVWTVPGTIAMRSREYLNALRSTPSR